jgi:hypothetical protein
MHFAGRCALLCGELCFADATVLKMAVRHEFPYGEDVNESVYWSRRYSGYSVISETDTEHFTRRLLLDRLTVGGSLDQI